MVKIKDQSSENEDLTFTNFNFSPQRVVSVGDMLVCMNVLLCVEARQTFLLCLLPPYESWQGLSLNLEVRASASLTSQLSRTP